jgi:two-component system, NarL family, sensor kinase
MLDQVARFERSPGTCRVNGLTDSAITLTTDDGLFEEFLSIQEYERKRLGQDLHDVTGQLLMALQLNIAHLRQAGSNSAYEALLDDLSNTVQEVDQQIRALAFLNYPAELGDKGLCSAVQTLSLGFGRRTGVHTTFKCVGDTVAVDREICVSLLRVTQEALANVHRHSHASSTKVVLQRRRDSLQLSISDDGIGISVEEVAERRGIGLKSMRHRIEAVNGCLRIANLKQGTKITATVPIPASAH